MRYSTRSMGPGLRPLGPILSVALLLAAVSACRGSGSSSGAPCVPRIEDPAGPGTVTGGPSSFTATVEIGASLDFSLVATHCDPTESLILEASVQGGSLTPAMAGFTTAFPASVTGIAPLTLSLSGTASMLGEVVFDVLAVDSRGRTATIQLTITIVSCPTTMPSSAIYTDVNLNSLVDQGDTLTIGFTRSVQLPPGTLASTTLVVTGGAADAWGGATLSPGVTTDEILVLLTDLTSFEPNGVFGVDPGASGVDLLPGQTAIVDAGCFSPANGTGFLDVQ